MGKVHVLPLEIALDYLALNPRWHKMIDAGFEKPKSGVLHAKEVALSELVENDPNNGYMDLRKLTRGYKIRGSRRRFWVTDSAGNVRYNGKHDCIEGVFRPEPLGQGHIQKNPTVAEKAMIAFKDGDEIYIISEGGSRLMIKSPFGEEVALYGAPFDEVHPFDVIIPVYRIDFEPTRIPNPMPMYEVGVGQVGAAKLVLGRKQDKWVLNNVFGEQFAESEDKEKLLHIVIASPGQSGDGLDFYSIEPAKEPASK